MNAYIVEAIRTPIGKYAGSLSSVRPDDLAALAIKALFDKTNQIPKELIDDVVLGCANQAGEDNRNVARMALLLAGLPQGVPGETVNRLCASGMCAVVNAARAVHAAQAELVIAGGVESMSRSPLVMPKAEQAFSREAKIFDTTLGWRFINPKLQKEYGTDSMGETAENVAAQWKISREDQDKFALWSQQKCATATSRGRLAKEIVPVAVKQGKEEIQITRDEFPRPTTTIESLGSLKPAFLSTGSVTAGNSSGINDGAAAIMIASEAALKKFNLSPKAKIIASAAAGVEPRTMGIGPVFATRKALRIAGLDLEKMDLIEMNEAFAAQCLACIREFGIEDHDPRINPNGGAIALGHPLGMSGARLIQTAAFELHEQKKRYALCTMCVGVGQGVSVILERV
ncbi:3-oxoadipyl-CoA thiolase [bacterium]|nr:3-oxoadipyl-CoA thiolase [bacterium]